MFYISKTFCWKFAIIFGKRVQVQKINFSYFLLSWIQIFKSFLWFFKETFNRLIKTHFQAFFFFSLFPNWNLVLHWWVDQTDPTSFLPFPMGFSALFIFGYYTGKRIFLLSSIYIRKKCWIRENFRLPVFDRFTCFEMSWTRFDHF